MHRYGLPILIVIFGWNGLAQTPQPKPPALLPPSVSGRPLDPLQPASAVVAKVAPADRFKNPGYSPETHAVLESAKDAAGWLARLSKSDGRFVPGIDATLQKETPGNELGQAQAALALCRAAKFTGDEKLFAIAGQACLTLLTLAKPDASDPNQRVPTCGAEGGNKFAFAACLASAIGELPNADAKLLLESEKLLRYVATALRRDGSIACAAEVDFPAIGCCLEALMIADRNKSEDWKREALDRAATFYRAAFAKTKSFECAASLLPPICDYAIRSKSETANAFAFELADWLCDQQYSNQDARNLRWVGGFKPTVGNEPDLGTANGVLALSAAVTLAANVPDATRYTRYRKQLPPALAFARSLQFSAANQNGLHFGEKFRNQWLYGGVHGSPSDGILKIERTAALLNAELRYLECGAEKAE